MKKILILAIVAICSINIGCAARSSNDVLQDSILTIKIRDRFANDAALNLFKIDVEARDRVATLTGFVPTEDRRRRAAESAALVNGIRNVENRIEVGMKKKEISFKDAVIRSNISKRLIRDPQTHALPIDVESNQGEVVLSGQVKNEDQKQLAERIAQNTHDVLSVKNHLKVMAE